MKYLAILFLVTTSVAAQTAPTDPVIDKVNALCKSLQPQIAQINAATGRKFEVTCVEFSTQPKPREKITIPLTSAEKIQLAYWRAIEDAGWGANYNLERDFFIKHGVMFNDTGLWNPKGTAFSNSKCGVTPMIISGTDFITLDEMSLGSSTKECRIWVDELWHKFAK